MQLDSVPVFARVDEGVGRVEATAGRPNASSAPGGVVQLNRAPGPVVIALCSILLIGVEVEVGVTCGLRVPVEHPVPFNVVLESGKHLA